MLKLYATYHNLLHRMATDNYATQHAIQRRSVCEHWTLP